MNELPDPLLELLKPSAPPESTALRQRLREQTSRQVQRRRLTRRLDIAASLAACLLALATVVYVIDRFRPQPVKEAAPVVTAPKPAAPPVEAEEETASPVALEWRAFDSQSNRAAAYFLAGDKYLEAGQDMESALRCYAQALDECTPAEMEIAPDDNWLVVSLKNARRKEMVHE